MGARGGLMGAKIRDEETRAIRECVQKLREGQLAPWKVEAELDSSYGLKIPGNFKIAALIRQHFIEEITGERFRHICVPEKPYKTRYHCTKDDFIL